MKIIIKIDDSKISEVLKDLIKKDKDLFINSNFIIIKSDAIIDIRSD